MFPQLRPHSNSKYVSAYEHLRLDEPTFIYFVFVPCTFGITTQYEFPSWSSGRALDLCTRGYKLYPCGGRALKVSKCPKLQELKWKPT